MADTTAPALATTKRKFYKLLDGFGSSSSVKTNKNGSTATLNEPSQKRTRLSVDSEPFTRTPSVRIIGSHVLAKTPNGKVLKATASPGRVPNYQPYSQEAFLTRLKTFSDVKIWTYKPSEISEVEWAKRGWVCDTKQVDTAACKGGCEARVVIRLERGRERAKTLESMQENMAEASNEEDEGEEEWDGAPDDELVKRYKDLIIDGHREACLWKTGGCKDDIYRIRMADASVWQIELADRYKSLLKIAPSLPDQLKLPGQDHSTASNTTKTSPESNDAHLLLSLDRIGSTLSPVLTSPANEPPQDSSASPSPIPNVTAAALALFGWTGSSPHNIHLATCAHCFQRIGLWLYTSDPSNKALPAAQTGIADDDILSFDVAAVHRDYCPWVSGTSQAGLGPFAGLAAWEIVLRLVEGKSARELSERRSAEGGLDEEDGGSGDAVVKSRGEQEKEDRERESRLAKLKRVFTVRKPDKKENRKSWMSLRG